MPLRPFAPLPKAADVRRRERSWVFTAGTRHFAFTRVDHSASFATGHRIVAPVPRGWRPTTIIGTMLGILGGLTLVGLAINSSRAAAGYRYVVSVPVPPARPSALHRPATPPAAIRKSPAPGRAVDPGVTVPSPAATNRDYAVNDVDLDEAAAAATSMTSAIRAAMTTGHLQQWSTPDGAERGFVVVGPEEAAARGCRSLSILTRRDGENNVESRRECVSRGSAAKKR